MLARFEEQLCRPSALFCSPASIDMTSTYLRYRIVLRVGQANRDDLNVLVLRDARTVARVALRTRELLACARRIGRNNRVQSEVLWQRANKGNVEDASGQTRSVRPCRVV